MLLDDMNSKGYLIRARRGLYDKTLSEETATEALAICKERSMKQQWCEVTDAATGEHIHGLTLIALAEKEGSSD